MGVYGSFYTGKIFPFFFPHLNDHRSADCAQMDLYISILRRFFYPIKKMAICLQMAYICIPFQLQRIVSKFKRAKKMFLLSLLTFK